MRWQGLGKKVGPWKVGVFGDQVDISHEDERVILGKVFDLHEARDLRFALNEIIRHAEAEEEANRADRR